MAKYQVRFASTFFEDLDKLDRAVQRQIMKWIEKHLHDVDFPTSPGKHLKGELSSYVRFRVSQYRIISHVDDQGLILTNLYVGHRSDVYKKKRK